MRVLVTGGSRGIGKQIVSTYLEAGYIVDAPTRDVLDLADLNSVKKYAKEHQKQGYDIIINNAGCNLINTIEKVEDADIVQMLNVNLVAPVYLLRCLVSYMKERQFGRIVNIGSIWGVVAKPGRSIYSATKHAIHGITTTLAVELAPYNILVNTVAPGQTLTDLTITNNSPEDIRQMAKDIPMGRFAQPEEIAKVVFFLGNEGNTYVTGQEIIVDGGLTLR